MQAACITVFYEDERGPELVHTTLYDLLQVIQEELRPGEEHLAAEVVSHMIEEGRVRLG
jgi:hypothetical protein